MPAGIKLVSEIRGGLITNIRMTPDTIVEHLDVFKNHLPSLLTAGKAVVMQTFHFERAKETLHRRIDAPILRSRSGLSPATDKSVSAVYGPMPN